MTRDILEVLEQHIEEISALDELYRPDAVIPKGADQVRDIVAVEMMLRKFLLANPDRIDEAKMLIESFISSEEESEDNESS